MSDPITSPAAPRVFTIRRFPEIPDGIPGVIFDGSIPFAVTMELGWKDNKPDESSFPPGKYTCRRFKSIKHPNTFEITGVPGRFGCLFHRGNIAIKDSRGCVLIAEKYGIFANSIVGIQESAEGFDEFMQRTADLDSFELVVIQV